MGIPKQDNAVFYHPLDDRRAGLTPPRKWSGDAEFAAGKVGDAAFGAANGEIAFGASEGHGGQSSHKAVRDSESFVAAYGYTIASDNHRGRVRLGSIDADGVITYGAEYEFFSSTKNPIGLKVEWLDSTRFIVAWRRGYQDPGGQYQARAVIGIVSGTDVTFGSDVDLGDPVSANAPDIQMAVLNPTTVVWVFYGSANPNNAYAKVAEITGVSGDTINVSDQGQVPDISMSQQPIITALDSTRLVLAWAGGNAGSQLVARIGTVVGSVTLTWGAFHTVNSADGIWGSGQMKSLEAIGDGRFLVSYNVNENSTTQPYESRVKVGYVSGTDIDFGAHDTLFSHATQPLGSVDKSWMALLPGGGFMLQYNQSTLDTYVKSCSVTGSTPDIGGAPYLVTSGSGGEGVWALDARSFLTGFNSSAMVGSLLGDIDLQYEAGVADFDGPDNVFLAADMDHVAITPLTPSTLVVAYTDEGNSNHGTVKLATVAGDAVTFGSPHEFLSADGAVDIAVEALDSTHFVVAYSDDSDSDHGTCKVGLVIGDDVTFGAEYEFLSAQAHRPALAVLGSSKFVVGYQNGTAAETSVRVGDVGGIIGLDITWGAEEVLVGTQTNFDVAATGPASFVAVYGEAARACTVSGTAVTLGTENPTVRSNSSGIQAVALTESTVATCFTGAGSTVRAQILSVDAGLVTGGPEESFSGYGDLGLTALDSSHIVICYRPDGDDLAAVGATVAGTGVTFGSSRDIAGPPREPYFGNVRMATAPLSGGRFAAAFGLSYGEFGSQAGLVKSGHVRVGEADFAGDEVLSHFGAEAEYLAAQADYNAVAILGGATVVVAYQNATGPAEARVGTLAGSEVTGFGAAASPSGATAEQVSVAVLDETHFVLCYSDDDDGNRGKAAVGEVAGSTITFGSVREFHPDIVDATACAALDSATVLVAWRASPTGGKAKVGVVTGTSISFGAEAEFDSTAITEVKAAAAGPSQALLCYKNASGGLAQVATVVGMDITFGAAAPFLAGGNATYISCRMVGSLSFAVSYSEGGLAGAVRIGTVAGTDITFGSAATFAATVSHTSVAPLSPTTLAVCYADGGDSGHGTARLGFISGDAVEFAPGEMEFLSAGAATYVDAVPVDSTRFAVAYTDGADSSHGTMRVGALGREAHATAVSGTKVVFASWFGSSDAGGPSTTLPPSGAPAVDSPIYEGMSTVSGTSAEADGTNIQVFVDYSPIGSTATVSGGTWSKDLGYEPALHSQITAKAKASGEDWSPHSAPVQVDNPVQHNGIVNFATAAGGAQIHVSAAKLSSTRFVVAYANTGGSDYARVGTLSGTTLTFGPQQGLPNTGSIWDELVALSDTKIVGFFGGQAYVGTVSGDAIAWGAIGTGGTPGDKRMGVVAMDANTVVVSADNDTRIGTVTGTDIVFSGNLSTPRSSLTDIHMAYWDPTHFVWLCKSGSSGYMYLAEIQAGPSIAWSVWSDFTTSTSPGQSGDTKHGLAAVPLGGGRLLVVWPDSDTARDWRYRIATISGATVSWGPTGAVDATSGPSENVSLNCGAAQASGGDLLIAYGAILGAGTWLMAKGGTDSPPDAAVWDSYRTKLQSPPGGYTYRGVYMLPMDATHAVVVYGRTLSASSSYGTAEVVWRTT